MPRGNATKENIEKMGFQEGQVSLNISVMCVCYRYFYVYFKSEIMAKEFRFLMCKKWFYE